LNKFYQKPDALTKTVYVNFQRPQQLQTATSVKRITIINTIQAN